jgi:hypothetical protein
VTVLDAQGDPLQPSGSVPDLLDQVCDLFDNNPTAWENLDSQIESLLNALEPRAADLNFVVLGERFFDCTNDAGKKITRLLAELAMRSLVKRRGDARKAAPTLKVLPKEDDGVNAPQA